MYPIKSFQHAPNPNIYLHNAGVTHSRKCSRSLPYAPVLRKNHIFRRTAVRPSKTPVIILSRPYISYGSTYGDIQTSYFRAVWTCVSMLPSFLRGWPFCFRTRPFIGCTSPFYLRSGRKQVRTCFAQATPPKDLREQWKYVGRPCKVHLYGSSST